MLSCTAGTVSGTKREFCTEKTSTLENTHLVCLTHTAEALHYLQINVKNVKLVPIAYIRSRLMRGLLMQSMSRRITLRKTVPVFMWEEDKTEEEKKNVNPLNLVDGGE